MIKEIERPDVLNQVTCKPRGNEDTSILALQKVASEIEKNGYFYTFVWIKDDGKMSVLGRVRIPDVGTILELITKASLEGWLDLNDYNRNIKWNIGFESMVK